MDMVHGIFLNGCSGNRLKLRRFAQWLTTQKCDEKEFRRQVRYRVNHSDFAM